MGDTVLVFKDGTSSPRFPSSTSSKCFDPTTQQGITMSLVSENETAGSSFIGEAFRYTDFYQKLLKLSWNPGDHQQSPDMSQWLSDGTGMQY